ncbi:hypothetical protein HDU96_000119 [Phlyctochytrium bullatum]|nr:hypothetical protein HDU96_000119 [Phlyctochytrium bullatum]
MNSLYNSTAIVADMLKRKRDVSENEDGSKSTAHILKRKRDATDSASDVEKIASFCKSTVMARWDANQKWVGSHCKVPSGHGLDHAIFKATLINSQAIALFLGSKDWDYPLRRKSLISNFRASAEENHFAPSHFVAHGPYDINVGSPDGQTWRKSLDSLIKGVQRCDLLGIGYFNIHPGNTNRRCSMERSIKLIADGINQALSKSKNVTILIENMAGNKGNVDEEVGSRFWHLRDIINQVHDRSRIGVCLDTCHLFAAGYDLRTEAAYEKTMSEFEQTVGFKYLKAMHLNDCKFRLGEKRDRHANIGKGYIGLEGFRLLMNDDRLNGIPMVLETPNCGDFQKTYGDEVELLYSLVGQ